MTPKIYSIKKLNEIGQGDPAFVQDMLISFLGNVNDAIKKINHFRSDDNWNGIAEVAHKLASNFAYLESKNLQTIASDIEKSVLIEKNLSGIADKTDKLCNDTILLVEQLKNDFDFLSTN